MKRKAETHYLLLGHFNNNSTWRWRNICCLTYILSVNKAKAISVGKYVLIIYVYVYIFIHIFIFGWLLVLRRMNYQCASSQCTFSRHANHAIRYCNTLSICRLVDWYRSGFLSFLLASHPHGQRSRSQGALRFTLRTVSQVSQAVVPELSLPEMPLVQNWRTSSMPKCRIMQSHVRWCFQTYILEFRIAMFCLPECLFPSAAPNPVLTISYIRHQTARQQTG